MEHIWNKAGELRAEYEVLREDRTPVDIFTFLEVDLGLDPIPFDDLTAKYRVEAAITADFTGNLSGRRAIRTDGARAGVEAEPVGFTVAHELAHYFLHRDVPQPEHFRSLPAFARWTQIHNRAGGQ